MSILIIFHMTQHNPMLRDIRAQLCGARFEAEVDQTIDLMLDWIRFVPPFIEPRCPFPLVKTRLTVIVT
jgi:hypothetical protein